MNVSLGLSGISQVHTFLIEVVISKIALLISYFKSGLISSEGLVDLLKHTHSFYYFFFFTRQLSFCFFFFVIWFMRWLIRPNHKLGKMFSAPSHAVSGRGLWFRACRFAAAVKGGGSSRAGPLRYGSVETVKAQKEVESFFSVCFSGFIFLCIGEGGGLVFRFQLNMMDQTCWKINIQSQTNSLSSFLLLVELFTPPVVHMWARTHTPTYHHCASKCRNTPAPLTLTIV